MDNQQLLVTDLDGTLWFDGELCHQKSLKAFEKIQDNGVTILIATGRRFRIVADTFANFGWRVPCLLLNGSLCYDFAIQKRLFSICFSQKENTEILKIFESHDLSPTLYADDSYVYACNPTTSEGHIEAIGPDLILVSALGSYSQRLDILNFCILGMPRENLEGVAKDLSDSGFANPSLYKDQIFDGYSLTVQPLNISKWSGILQWCEYTNFSPSRIITVGDAGNDLEMLIHADKSIVIAGAEKRLLDIADHVIPPPKVGGWSEILHFL